MWKDGKDDTRKKHRADRDDKRGSQTTTLQSLSNERPRRKAYGIVEESRQISICNANAVPRWQRAPDDYCVSGNICHAVQSCVDSERQIDINIHDRRLNFLIISEQREKKRR